VGQLSDSGMLPPGYSHSYEDQPWLSDSALNAIAPDGPSEDEAEAEPEDGNVDAAPSLHAWSNFRFPPRRPGVLVQHLVPIGTDAPSCWLSTFNDDDLQGNLPNDKLQLLLLLPTPNHHRSSWLGSARCLAA